MSVLIIGGNSLLGEAVYKRLTAGRVVRTTRKPDLAHEEGWEYLDLLQPTFLGGEDDNPFKDAFDAEDINIVLIVAAMTGIVQCEVSADAWRVNADAPIVLAATAKRFGWRAVFVSSDAVEVAPHTAYAMQKAHAEVGVLAMGGIVFRPARIGVRYRDVAAALIEAASTADIQTIVRWPA